MALSFYSGDHLLEKMASQVVVMTGAARSGKSTVSNILGSCKNVEHIEEPFPLMVLPILSGNGDIPEDLAVRLFRTSLVEILNDRILMRNANFRPGDTSSIWDQKPISEILNRVLVTETRKDVMDHLDTNLTTVVLTLTDTLPYSGFFWKAIPDCQVIHVLRGGHGVAQEVSDRAWFSDDQILKPTTANPFKVHTYNNTDYHLPYWVEAGHEQDFVDSSLFIRSLDYWRRLIGLAVNQPWEKKNPNLHVIKLHELVDNPSRVIGDLLNILNITKTEITESLISKVYFNSCEPNPIVDRGDYATAVVEDSLNIYEHYQLPDDLTVNSS